MRNGGRHVHRGDVGKLAAKGVVKTGLSRRPKRSDAGGRQFRHLCLRKQHKKVHAHRAPIHLAQAGDAALHQLTGDVELHAVAQNQAQRFRQAVFHTDAACFFRLPAAATDLVVAWQLCTVAEVELTFDQALRTFVVVLVAGDGLAVDGDQAATNHRVPVELLHTCIFQVLLKRIALFGLNVDHKTVGRVRRCGLAPAADEVGAQQHEQHQGQQTDTQCRHLQHRKPRPRRNLPRGQNQPTRCA